MRRLSVAALVVVVVVVVAAVAAVRHDDSGRSLEAAAGDVVALGVPGIIVRLRDGDDVYELARGNASAGDRFRVGSVTKTYVAALALTLADAGVLALDDTVAEYLPELLRDGDRVTVRQLLGHTAGLFDYTLEPELLNGDLPPRALVAIADKRERSTGYAYSSTNYLALGLVLEAATGMPLRDAPRAGRVRALRSREHVLRGGSRSRPVPPRLPARVAGRDRRGPPEGHERRAPLGPHGRRRQRCRRLPTSTGSSRSSWPAIWVGA